MANKEKLKLYYFDLEARAEVTRIMLRLSGVDFEDIRIPVMPRDANSQWVSKYKHMSPTRQCPFLELPNGKVISQTAAVEVYVGMITGLMPTDPQQAAEVVMICHTWLEVWQSLRATWNLKDEAEKLAARAKLMADDGETHLMLAALERMLGGATTAFSVSDELTVADVNTFQYVKVFESGLIDGVTKAHLSKYPRLLDIRNKVAAHPKVAPLYAA